MKTLYGKLKVPKIILKLPALIFLFLALAYNASSQVNNSPVCYGDPFVLSGTGGTLTTVGAISYTWQGNGTAQTIAVSNDPLTLVVGQPMYPSQAGAYVYTLTITYLPAPYTTLSAPTVVTLVTNPSNTITNTPVQSSVCSGTAAVTTYTTEGNTNPAFVQTYAWSVSGTGVSWTGTNTTTCTVNWPNTLAPGIYTITLQVGNTTSGKTCTQTIYNNFAVTHLAIGAISGVATVCSGTTQGYFVSGPATGAGSTGTMTYVWELTGGGIFADGKTTTRVAFANNGTPAGKIYNITWGTAGTGNISVYAYSSVNTCMSDPVTLNVLVHSRPTSPVISGTFSICTVGVPYLYAVTQQPNETYRWAATGASPVTNTYTTSSVTVNWPAGTSGTYSVTVWATSTVTNCESLAYTQTIAIQPIGTPVITSPNGTVYVCIPGGATNTTVQYNVAATNATTFAWSLPTGGTLTDASLATCTVVWDTPGTRTLTVNVGNSAGCTNTVSKSIVVGTTPDPSIVENNLPYGKVCEYSTTSYSTTPVAGAQYSWNVLLSGSVATVTGNGTPNITVTWGSAGVATITVKVKTGYCEGTSPALPIIVGQRLNPVVISNVPAVGGLYRVCENTNGWQYASSISGEGMTYEWTIVTGNNTAGNVRSISVDWGGPGSLVAGTATGTIKVTTSKDGCTADSPILSVQIMAAPAAHTPTVPDLNVCVSQGADKKYLKFSAPLDAANGGSNYAKYLWSYTGVALAGGTSTPTAVNFLNLGWTSLDAKTVGVRYTNVPGNPDLVTYPNGVCLSSPELFTIVTVQERPAPVIQTPVAVCEGSLGTYYTDLGYNSYNWGIEPSGSGQIQQNGTSSVVVLWYTAGPGARTVTVSYANAYGCTNSVTVKRTAIVNPKPDETFAITGYISPNAEVCVGTSNDFSIAAGYDYYIWSVQYPGGGNAFAGTRSTTVNYTLPGLWTITVNYRSTSSTCTGTTTTSVVASPIPTNPALDGPLQVCTSGSPYSNYITDLGMNNYSWSILPAGAYVNIFNSNTATPTVEWNTSFNGTATVRVEYRNHSCLVYSTEQVAVGNYIAPFSITGPTPVCGGSSGNIYTAGYDALVYDWHIQGPPNTYVVGPTDTRTISVTWGEAGVLSSVSMFVNVETASGCTGSSTIYPISLLTPPAVYSICAVGYSYTPTTNLCPGENTPEYTLCQGGLYSYTWFISPAITPATGSVTISAASAPYYQTKLQLKKLVNNGTTAKVYTITVKYYNNDPYTSTGACYNWSAIHTVNVNPRAFPTVTSNSATVCEGKVVTYTTQAGKQNYDWSVSGPHVIVKDAASNVATITWTYVAGQLYTVTAIYDSENGCPSAAATRTKYDVTVKKQMNLPVIEDLNTSYTCQTTTRKYQIVGTGLTLSELTWSVDNGGIITGATTGVTSITVTWPNSGTGIVTLAANNGYCTDVETKSVDIHAQPQPTIAGPSTVCRGSSVDYYGSVQSGVIISSYDWYVTGTGTTTIVSSTYSRVTVFWDGSEGLVTVSAASTYGCLNTSSKAVAIEVGVPTIGGDADAFTFCGYTPHVYHEYYAGYSPVGDYNWTLPSGVYTYTAVSGSRTITIGYEPNFGTEPYVSTLGVEYTPSCGTAVFAKTMTVTVNPIPQPVVKAVSGVYTVCAGSTAHYTVYNVTAGNDYEWFVEGGTYIGQNTPNITVTWNSGIEAGYIWVKETNAFNCYVTSAVRTITIIALPAPVILASPATNPVTGSFVDYYITEHNWTLKSWNVPTGGVIVAPNPVLASTSSITVRWDLGGNHTVNVVETVSPWSCSGSYTLPVTVSGGTNTLSGTFKYDNAFGTPLNGVTVNLYKGALLVGSTTTNAAGIYTFSNLAGGNDYSLLPTTTKQWEGVNATDALIVQMTALCASPAIPLSTSCTNLSVFKQNAGDVALNVCELDAADALAIKQRAVGATSTFGPLFPDWRFNTSLCNSGSVNPVLFPVPSTQPFLGLCAGDVNGSFVPNGLKQASLTSLIADGIQEIRVNEAFKYEIKVDRNAELGAATLYIGYDQNLIEIEGVTSAMLNIEYKISDGRLAIAWSDMNYLKIDENEAIITLTLRAVSKIEDPMQIFVLNQGSEIADPFAQPIEVALKSTKLVTVSGEFALANYPNPFKNTTEIVYTLPEQGHVKLIITNILGEVISTMVDAEQAAGSYKLTVDPLNFNLQTGVYLYKIEVNGVNNKFVKTNKMLFTR